MIIMQDSQGAWTTTAAAVTTVICRKQLQAAWNADTRAKIQGHRDRESRATALLTHSPK